MIAGVQFKAKYVDSALDYWSHVKPLSYFAVLWVFFGRFFDGAGRFALYLRLEIACSRFFVDAVGGTARCRRSTATYVRSARWRR